jgi:hypothetical protein
MHPLDCDCARCQRLDEMEDVELHEPPCAPDSGCTKCWGELTSEAWDQEPVTEGL